MTDDDNLPTTLTSTETDTLKFSFSSLSEPLRQFASAAFPDDDDNNITGASINAFKRLDDFEVALRSHAFSLVEELMSQYDTDGFDSSLLKLLSYLKDVTTFTVDMVTFCQDENKSSDSTQRLPKSYEIITTNTLLHRLPISILNDVTISLPISTVQKLWSSIATPQNDNSINFLSTLCHPTLFPHSKMPLLKICNSLLKNCSNRSSDAEFAGSILTTLSQVMPLSERSAMNVLGSFNVDNCTVWEGREEFERGVRERGGVVDESDEKQSDAMDIDEGGASATTSAAATSAATTLGYEFYNTFWSVQKVFTDPPNTILSDGSAFTTFIQDIKTILAAFESTPAMSTVQKQHHYKYLTSSQLLHLQLKDPEIRTHFLTQLIILLSHLNSSSVTFPKSTTNKQMQQSLSELEKQTQSLLKFNSGHLRATCWILKERESMYKHWKRNKCSPSLEREDDRFKFDGLQRLFGGRKKRKVDTVKSIEVDICHHLPGTVSKLQSSIPQLANFMQPYVEACDPENQVDAEYHPNNDSVYCWRGLRLLARSQEGHLVRFEGLNRQNGNFEGVIRDVWKERGEPIPGTYVCNSDECTFEKRQEDVEMDDVSVGTPEVDKEKRMEKMTEFAKAALEEEDRLFEDDDDDDGGLFDDEKGDEVEDAEMKEGQDKATVGKEEKGDDKHDVNGEEKGGDGKPVANGEDLSTEDKDTNVEKVVKEDAKKEQSIPAAAKIESEESDNKPSEQDKTSSVKSNPPASATKEKSSVKPKTVTKTETKERDKDVKETSSKAEKSTDGVKAEPSKKETPSTSSSTPASSKPKSVKEEAPQTTQSDANPVNQASTKTSNGGNEPKPTVHSVKPRAKFTPREQIRHKRQNSKELNKNQQQDQQDRPKDGTHSAEHSARDAGGRPDRRDSHRAHQPPQHQQRGGRFGNRDEKHHTENRGNDTRDKRDGFQGRGGRGSWQPPRKGGRDGNRGPRDDRRGGRGRR